MRLLRAPVRWTKQGLTLSCCGCRVDLSPPGAAAVAAPPSGRQERDLNHPQRGNYNSLHFFQHASDEESEGEWDHDVLEVDEHREAGQNAQQNEAEGDDSKDRVWCCGYAIVHSESKNGRASVVIRFFFVFILISYRWIVCHWRRLQSVGVRVFMDNR